MFRKIAFFAGLIIAVVICILAVPAKSGGSAAANPQLDSEEQAFVALVNQYRAQNGLRPLAIDWHMEAAADWMSTDMGQKDYVSHTDSLGRDPWTRLCDFGYCANTWKGENIAAGYIKAADVFAAWQSSPDHNANMLGAHYTVMGISRAFTAGSHYGWYWTNDFGGVQTSSSPTPSPTPARPPVTRTATPTPAPYPTNTPTKPPTTPVAGLCPAVTGASHANVAGPLVISAPGVYNGDGRTVIGGENNVSIEASDVTVCNYTLQRAQGASVNIGAVNNVTLSALNIQDFNQAGEGGTSSGGPQYAGGVACWYCTRLTVVDSVIATGKFYGDGIWVKRTNAAEAGPDYLARNSIFGGWDGIGSEPEGNPDGGLGSGTVIEGNTVAGCHDDGIQAEGRDENITIRNNTITRCGTGVATAPVLVGPIHIENNYIHDLVLAPSTAFFCFKLGASQGSNTPEIFYYGNTCVSPGAGGFEQTNSGLSYNIVATHNCIQDGLYVIDFNEAPGPGTSFDYNTLFTTDSDRFAKWDGQRYDLAGLRGLGQELHGVESQSCRTSPPADTPTPTPIPAPPSAPISSPMLPPPPAPTVTPSAVPAPTSSASASAAPARMKGDANCDGAISAADVVRLLQTIGEIEHGAPACATDPDLNCDGQVNALDVLTVLLWLTGQPANLPDGCAGVTG